MAEFGWAYIEGGALTGSGGPHGALQFRTPGGVNGSKDFIYDTGSGRVAIGVDWPNLDGKTIPNAMLHVNGDVSVTGTIYASQYQIAEVTSIQSSGDSRFGDSSGDIHEFTGSVKVEGSITATGDLTASMGILIPDTENVTNPTAAGIGLHVGTGGDLSLYHDGSNSFIFNQTGDLKIESTVNSAECILLHANGGTAETIKIYADQGTAGNAITLATDAGGILFNLDATSGKKLHADVESTDADAIHLDSEGGIKLESDAEPVYITGGLLVSGSSVILCNADTSTVEVKGVLTASADVIVADDKKIYFGTGKDASFEYDEDGTDTLLYAGASIRISDDTKIEFGTGGDATIEYDENGTNELRFAGAAVLFEQIVTHEAHPIFETGITIKNADDSAGYINFYEQSSNGTNVCTFRGKSSMGNCTITLPGQTGTVVLEDNTVTLSNKTLSAPTITGLASFEGNVTLGNADTDVITLTGQATASAGLLIPDADAVDKALQIGTGGDFYIAHDGTDTAIANATGKLKITSTSNVAEAIRIRTNAGTSETIKIHSDQGTSVTEGASSIQLLSDAGGVELKSAANLAKSIKLIADGGTSETIYIQSDQGTGADSIHLLSDAGGITLQVGSGKLVTVNGGDLVPSADNTLDLGAADKRWQNIYTGDLHLKNDRGDWTIVEESDYLSLRNNGTGKLYKFVLEEVDEE